LAHSRFIKGFIASMTEYPIERFSAQIAAGELDADPSQRKVAERLDTLARQLQDWMPARRRGLASLWTRAGKAPRGLYIHGAVGRGKTMLMDIFHEVVAFAPKRRSHFHEFMADVHERIGAARGEHPGDPIPAVADAIADEAALLCFDEMQVTDIADAMILGRLFQRLFDRGVVVVATSNAVPRQLYKDGLNRQLFLPFVDLIEEHMDAVELKSAKDYRLDKLSGLPLYFTPADTQARQALDRHWERLTGRRQGRTETLHVKGRDVRVPSAAMGVARFDFADLCEAPLGAVDYLRIAHAYHTVLIDNIPVLRRENRSAARRFVNLIDTLYDSGVCLIASAEAWPEDLYGEGQDAAIFERTSSRLTEMRSEAYIARRRGGTPAKSPAAGPAR
jgi:cell division protein ZapE